MFKKIYVEITNVCNLSCPFCHGTKRSPRFMSASDFALVAEKLRSKTQYIYLHVLGEPLLHPELGDILAIAAQKGFKCCITTNGTLIRQNTDTLLSAEGPHKLSVSLHSFEANSPDGDPTEYLDGVWSACEKLAEKGTICSLRLWNGGGQSRKNEFITEFLCLKAGIAELIPVRKGFKLKDNIYLEYADEFEWPDIAADMKGALFCHGLRDQIGILSDGTVIPCCLDADGSIALGNIFESSLDDILSGERAVRMYEGFSKRCPSEELCRRCGYATRFNK